MSGSVNCNSQLTIGPKLEGPTPLLDSQNLDGASREVQHLSTSSLRRIGTRPGLFSYIRQLLQRRHFIREESRAKAFGSIKNTVLGRLWLILEPFLSAGIYFFIFAVILRFDRGVDNFVAYLVVGVIFFGYLTQHITGGATIMTGGRNLIRAFAFPRASLVLSFARRTGIDFLPTIVAVLLFISIVPPHALPSLTWLATPIAMALAVPFAVGLSLIVATLTTLLKDLKFIWPLLTRFWFYSSGIFWHINMFQEGSLLHTAMQLNPGWVVLELCRQTLIYGTIPPLSMWLYFAAWSFGLFVVGFILFWSQEERFSKDDR